MTALDPDLQEPQEHQVSVYHMTHQEIADALGITRTSVARIEERALLKCSTWIRKHYPHLADLIDLS